MDEKMEGAYKAGMAACGIEVGDKVQVVFTPYEADTRPEAGGWGVYWNQNMSARAGKILSVCLINGMSIQLSDGYNYPWFCLKKVADAEEKKPEPDCPFSPGDLVIVRDGDDAFWVGARLTRVVSSSDYPYVCGFVSWKQCLLLAGNENLVGTKDSPSSTTEPVVEEKETLQLLAPFTKVLVRDRNSDHWRINFYGYFSPEDRFPYHCAMSSFKQCIPYEGNEHLLGTSNSPE